MEGILFVEFLVCLGGRGERKKGRDGERNGVREKEGGWKSLEGGEREGRKRRGEKERNLDLEYFVFFG